VPAIGITGGIGTGKSTFVDELRRRLPEARFFDADVMARELTRRDKDVLEEIRAGFGNSAFHQTGELNRAVLRAIISSEPEKRRALEEILHPRIRRYWSGEAQQYRKTSDFFFADIPLLYETGGEKLCDAVVVVSCSEDVQIERLSRRMKISLAEVRRLITLQMPLVEKINRADHVVWNNGPINLLRDQADLLVDIWMRR
jgi:dephospho-CoA kinase